MEVQRELARRDGNKEIAWRTEVILLPLAEEFCDRDEVSKKRSNRGQKARARKQTERRGDQKEVVALLFLRTRDLPGRQNYPSRQVCDLGIRGVGYIDVTFTPKCCEARG